MNTRPETSQHTKTQKRIAAMLEKEKENRDQYHNALKISCKMLKVSHFYLKCLL